MDVIIDGLPSVLHLPADDSLGVGQVAVLELVDEELQEEFAGEIDAFFGEVVAVVFLALP
jgi:hypothetical protein